MEKKSILVVEDEEIIREHLSFALKTQGYPVVTAANGLEAIECLKFIDSPGLILLDLMMPVMDGKSFIQKLHSEESLANKSQTPIILVTAFKVGPLERGVKDVILKPLDINDLINAVKRYSL